MVKSAQRKNKIAFQLTIMLGIILTLLQNLLQMTMKIKSYQFLNARKVTEQETVEKKRDRDREKLIEAEIDVLNMPLKTYNNSIL
jgi:Fic family protein